MSLPLLGLVTAIYAGVAIDQVRQGQLGMGLVFAGYKVANVGLMLAMR